MNANHFKQFHLIIIILTLVGTIVLVGCATNNQVTPTESEAASTPTSQNDDTPTDEAEEDASGNNVTPIIADDSTSDDEQPPAPDTDIPDTVALLTEKSITSLNPYLMENIHPDGSVSLHLWDTLTLLNSELQIEPHLAQSWRLINNFTWEIDLQEGVTFHNGEPFDAQAVQFSVELSQSMPGSLETFAIDVDLDRVEVVDDYTVRFVTRKPVTNIPYYLAFLEMLPPNYYAETNLEQLAVSPIGSGPYRLKEISTTDHQLISLEAVPDYWKGSPTFSELLFHTVPTEADRLAASTDNNEVALIIDLSSSTSSENLSTARVEAVESTQRMLVGIRITPDSPLADQRVRQALNYGVDVQQIVDTWLNGYGMRYGSWVNPPSNNPDLAPWPYDPELSRQLLQEAGYTTGLTLTLRTPVDVYDHDVDIANTIAQQLAEIGVEVRVETVSNWNVYARDLLSGNSIDLFLLAFNSHGDGLQDVKNLSSRSPFNPIDWQNNVFENLIDQATTTFNDSSRARLLNEAQSIAYEEAPWIWLWRKYDFYGVSENLDWKPRRDGLIYLYQPVDSSTESEN